MRACRTSLCGDNALRLRLGQGRGRELGSVGTNGSANCCLQLGRCRIQNRDDGGVEGDCCRWMRGGHRRKEGELAAAESTRGGACGVDDVQRDERLSVSGVAQRWIRWPARDSGRRRMRAVRTVRTVASVRWVQVWPLGRGDESTTVPRARAGDRTGRWVWSH